MREFLVAAFGKRLRFGLPLGAEATFTVRVARLACWRCHAWTQILKEVEVTAGPHQVSLSVPDLRKYGGLWDRVRAQLPSSFPSGTIHRRYNRTQGREYLSNGCSHCGALVGGHFEYQESDDVRVICEYTARLDEVWRTAIQHQQGSLAGWGVY
jgi:competence protein CoiA